MEKERTGLVLEGGAMRGMFSCGVTDVFLEEGICFDGVIGVSAGAVFSGCNFKSRQVGRAIRYNKKYCADPRYCGARSLLTTGNLFNVEFCYHTLPEELDPFDAQAFRENPVEFYVTCTDVRTGRPVYQRCMDGGGEDLLWMRASASMPLVSRIVKIGDRELLDGGISDSIPVDYFRSLGFRRCVVVLTQPDGYVKEPNSMMPAIRVLLRKYPGMVTAMEDRHIRYNRCTAAIREAEGKGALFVIRPPEALRIGSTEKDPAQLERVYQTGRREAQKRLKELRAYLERRTEE